MQFPAGKRVLDIATGNGVLLVWGARAARAAGRELTLTGIDLADIDPARFLPEHRVNLAAARFIGNTAAESLPFAASMWWSRNTASSMRILNSLSQ